MPFKRSDAIRKRIFDEPEFESDEEYTMDFSEQDKDNAEKLETQNDILDTMKKTLVKMTNALSKNRPMPMANTLKIDIEKKHKSVKGLKDDYEYVSDAEEQKK